MLNAKTVSSGGFAAEVSSANLVKSDTNSAYDLIKYTTVDPHNFFVGSQVTIVGVAGSFSKTILSVAHGKRTVDGSSTIENGYARFRLDKSFASFFKVGDTVQISGVVGYNGFYIIQYVGSNDANFYFSVLSAGTTDVTPASGTAAVSTLYSPAYNKTVYSISSPTSFLVKLDREVDDSSNITFTSTSGTAYAINGALSSVDVLYAQPDL
jgi:hypothetical protein